MSPLYVYMTRKNVDEKKCFKNTMCEFIVVTCSWIKIILGQVNSKDKLSYYII